MVLFFVLRNFCCSKVKKETQKGKTMLLNNNNDNTSKWSNQVRMTKHYMERYYERVLHIPVSTGQNYNKMEKEIFIDMDNRLMDREKLFIRLFSSSRSAKVPFEKINQIIIKNNTLVTILN